MSDRPDSKSSVVVAVSQGEVTHQGEDRRSQSDTNHPNVNVNMPGRDEEPVWQRGWPKWAKMMWHMGPFSMVCLVFLGGVTCVAQERAADRAYDRADRIEERELRRAEADQYQRHNDVITTKFDALVTKIDVAMERATTNRLTVERIQRELTDALDRLFAELKRLVPGRKPVAKDKDKEKDDPQAAGVASPILGLTDHAPPMRMPAPTELAPMPRSGDTTGDSQGP